MDMPIIIPPIKGMEDAFSVKGKNVVVTGGNTGIGRGIVQAFAESGANVAILCRNVAAAEAAVEEISSFGGRYTAISCDIASKDSVGEAVKKVLEFYDHVDVLINNAGVATNTPFFTEKGLEEWERVVNTNLHGTAYMIHALVPSMMEKGLGGEVINITSIGAQRVYDSKDHPNAPYNASKAGLDHFSRHLAVVLGDYGIRVNTIAPGLTHSNLDKDLPQATIGTQLANQPSHRFGEPIEIGALCVFLSSAAGAEITGATIAHDGGRMWSR